MGVSSPVRGIHVGPQGSGKTTPGASFIGDAHTFPPDGHMATASTGGGFLRTKAKLDMAGSLGGC